MLLVMGVFFSGFIILKPQLDAELQKLVHKTAGRSFEINFFDYGKIRLSGLGFVFGPVRARGLTRVEHPYFDPRELEVTIPSIRMGLRKFTLQSFQVDVQVMGLQVKGGRRLHEDFEDHERLESVSKVDFETSLELGWVPFSWKSQVAKRAKEFKAWVFEDQPIHDLKLQGSAVFIVDDWPVTVQFHSTVSADGSIQLAGEPEDLRVVVEMIEPKFTDADLKLAAANLIRAPKLLRFRTEAEKQAKRLHMRDTEILYDVPRHIYWSYFLTKAYGEDFARETTNAHEIGDELNTAVESDKDRHHNALGIEYAKRNLSEAEVEKLIFSDPRVIRFTKDGKPKKPAVASAA